MISDIKKDVGMGLVVQCSSHGGLTSTEAIADLMRGKLPYADVIGADTEQEMLANLTDVLAPFVFNVSNGGSVVEEELGCFIGGAGKREENRERI